ncbi:hypothetical protein BDP27DRAFT_1370061 [Rhodocollybia butyracea]|uniref:Uncharacterized protein n=1 Tax=Rhodocollybia butyracea TaxID=206335 RepID=A0A9P5PF69_9AGAR|nr:hypothetical protein BDP27DRAFT_1370061 [Rhodocollybia butyracea]
MFQSYSGENIEAWRDHLETEPPRELDLHKDLMKIHKKQREEFNDLRQVHLGAIRLRLKIWVLLRQEMTEEAITAITAEDPELFQSMEARVTMASTGRRRVNKLDQPMVLEGGYPVNARNMFAAEYLETHQGITHRQFMEVWENLPAAQKSYTITPRPDTGACGTRTSAPRRLPFGMAHGRRNGLNGFQDIVMRCGGPEKVFRNLPVNISNISQLRHIA